MSPYIIGLVAVIAIACLVSLHRISVIITNAASATFYLGAYLVIAVSSGVLLMIRIASLGTLTPVPRAAPAILYVLAWLTVLYIARPLVREGFLRLSVTADQVRLLVLTYFGFDPAKPYILVYRLWNKRRGKPTVLYIRP